MVGAGIQMRLHCGSGVLDAAHPDDRAGQPVRPASHQIGFVKALTQPRIPIVGQAAVDLQVIVCTAQLFLVITADHHGLLGDDPLVRSQDRPGRRGGRRQHQVRVGAVGVAAGQLDHLGPQRRQ